MSCAGPFRSRRPPAVTHGRVALGRYPSRQRKSVNQESSPHSGSISALSFPGCLLRPLSAHPDDFVHLRLPDLEQGPVWLSPLKCPVARLERCPSLSPLTPGPGIFCRAMAGEVILAGTHRLIVCGIRPGSSLGRASCAQCRSRLCFRTRRQSGFFLRVGRLASLSASTGPIPVMDSPRPVLFWRHYPACFRFARARAVRCGC